MEVQIVVDCNTDEINDRMGVGKVSDMYSDPSLNDINQYRTIKVDISICFEKSGQLVTTFGTQLRCREHYQTSLLVFSKGLVLPDLYWLLIMMEVGSCHYPASIVASSCKTTGVLFQ